MDLQTIENKLKLRIYNVATQFHDDISKIFRNSYTFNKDNESFIKITSDFEQYYFKIMSEAKSRRKNRGPKSESSINLQKMKSEKLHEKKERKMTTQLHEVRPSISIKEKHDLSNNISRLNKNDLCGLAQIIYPNADEAKDSFNIEELTY